MKCLVDWERMEQVDRQLLDNGIVPRSAGYVFDKWRTLCKGEILTRRWEERVLGVTDIELVWLDPRWVRHLVQSVQGIVSWSHHR